MPCFTRPSALEHLKEAALKRYQELKIEPPATKHLERLIRSALHTYTEHFCADILQRIPPATRVKLDTILETSKKVEIQAVDDELAKPKRSVFFELKKGPGSISYKSILAEVDKLQHIRQLDLPGALFQHVSPNVLKQYRQRVASEGPREVRGVSATLTFRVQFFADVVSSDSPAEQLELVAKQAQEVFRLNNSSKHMVGRDLGRLEPTPTLKYRVRDVLKAA